MQMQVCKLWEKANVVDIENSNNISQKNYDSNETTSQDMEEKHKLAQDIKEGFKPQPAPRNVKRLNNEVVQMIDKSENNVLSSISTSSDDLLEGHVLKDKRFSTNIATSVEKPKSNSMKVQNGIKAESSKPKALKLIFNKKHKMDGNKTSINHKNLFQPKTDANVSTRAHESPKR